MRPLIRILTMTTAAVVGAVALAGASAAPDGAYVSQGGGARTKLALVSGCSQTASSTLCADGADRPGPHVAITTPGSIALRFDRPANAVFVRVAGVAADITATRIDNTHWRARIGKKLAGPRRVHVLARGGSQATHDRWDAVYVATLTAPKLHARRFGLPR